MPAAAPTGEALPAVSTNAPACACGLSSRQCGRTKFSGGSKAKGSRSAADGNDGTARCGSVWYQ